MKSGFFDKLIDRLDKIDPKSLQTHFLRLAQEKGLLETIFQSIQEGIIVIDGAGSVTYANKSAENLMGFSLEMAQGRQLTSFIRTIDWSGLLRFDETEWTHLVTREIEITYPEHRFVAFYVVPLSLSSAGQKGAVVILRDITHDRAMETSVLESERINAIKLLAASVAHEIGNPLNALNIHLQLLDREVRKLDKNHKKELKELLDVARGEVSRLDVIITQFLQAIRPSTPKFVLHSVETVLKETLALLKQEITNRNITIEVEKTGVIPRIRMDKGQIKQVFVNIIRNAAQAMPDGGSLIISMASTDQFAAVAFRDTGVGIKPENFGRIFEPYHTTKEKGSGLGLMIVQRIVQDHGGRIEIASKPDKGTSFTILLPLAEKRMKLLPRARDDQNGDDER